MRGKGAPGLCLKMPPTPGNTSTIPQRTPFNDPRETITGILVEIDSDTCHDYKNSALTEKKNFFYTPPTKKKVLINST